ncbi:hypothetical protein RB620_29695 [Paenibacillus sp. LHD-117]|uniref:hypothetical protein n=1 Tax=Paenibacillus sp. LHD-117 TaxID=3071412 RepID=UPI0027DF8698|nr:hypothetical protein [Paenibacillus sp. LHD-117]MDQ6423591.1 hypothetical protein [Paenibacillus sp. LHD-117]
MFQVDSYLMKPQCNVTDLRDVVNNPQNYFVEINDSTGLKAIYKNLDFQYLNGAICLKYYGESMLDMRYWDLIDQLWAYIMNLIDDVLQKGEGSVYFPDQPVKIILRLTSKELLLFSVEGSEISNFVLPKSDFLIALVQGAEQFFTCMTNTYGSDCDYSYELERIDRLKQELQ